MLHKNPPDSGQFCFFKTFRDTLDHTHPLFTLAQTINWGAFDEAFAKHYSPSTGRPAKPIRLMTGLLILKHVRNLSDESVVEQWRENSYYQHFCGGLEFATGAPCDPTELVYFRQRVGEAGMELIFKESIRVNGDDAKEEHVVADTTVQEKNITFPTDAKLDRKIIEACKDIAESGSIPLRQSYTRTLKKLSHAQRNRSHPKRKKKARKADKRVKTIAGRLVRELQRKLPANDPRHCDLSFYTRVLAQKRDTKNKVYSLHEREVCCIAKGKEHKQYEFGNKVSLLKTKTKNVIVGALSLRNDYDGHTLAPALEQHQRLTGVTAKTATTDLGYKGEKTIGTTLIQIPDPGGARKKSRRKRERLCKDLRRRAAIEPVIGHLKTDHRLCRNFYKGVFGDSVNLLLAAAAFNFKRMLNKWRLLPHVFSRLFVRLFPRLATAPFRQPHRIHPFSYAHAA